MEHRTILGGEEYLPFARSCVTKLKKLGLSHASQAYEVGGVSIKVRIEPGHEYIRIEGGAPNVHVVFVVNDTASTANEQSGHYWVYSADAPRMSGLKLVSKYPMSHRQTLFEHNLIDVGEMLDTADSTDHKFIGVFNNKTVVRRTDTTYRGSGPAFDWGRSGTLTESVSLLHGVRELASGTNTNVDGRTNRTKVKWHNTVTGFFGELFYSGTAAYPEPPPWEGFTPSIFSGPEGVQTWNFTSGNIPTQLGRNTICGITSTTSITTTFTAPDEFSGPFAVNYVTTTSSAEGWAEIDLDDKSKFRPTVKNDMSLVPHAATTVTIPGGLGMVVPREIVDFRHRAVEYWGMRVVSCCRYGAYITGPGITRYASYSGSRAPETLPAPPPDGLGRPDLRPAVVAQHFDDFVIRQVMVESGYGLPPSWTIAVLISYSRTTGEEIAAVAFTGVPLADSYYPSISDPATRIKRRWPKGLPAHARFVTVMRDEAACM